MLKSTKTLLALAAISVWQAPAIADPVREVTVRTHPSQGEVSQVADASARLLTDPTGAHVSMQTNGLMPGNVYTLLMAVINKPGACPVLPCTPKDVLGRSDTVLSDVAYAGGVVATRNGHANFDYYQPLGQFQQGFFENGLSTTEGVEIHLILNDHGPLIEGREFEMLTSYRGGCSDESIPGPMPLTARAQGQSGPNTCRMVQFAQFVPDSPAS